MHFALGCFRGLHARNESVGNPAAGNYSINPKNTSTCRKACDESVWGHWKTGSFAGGPRPADGLKFDMSPIQVVVLDSIWMYGFAVYAVLPFTKSPKLTNRYALRTAPNYHLSRKGNDELRAAPHAEIRVEVVSVSPVRDWNLPTQCTRSMLRAVVFSPSRFTFITVSSG